MPKLQETKIVPIERSILFAVVADVAAYGDYLPWCLGTRVYNQRTDEFDADLLIGFKMFRERYTSRVSLTPETKIISRAIRGPLKHLINIWTFEDAGADSTKVSLDLDFEFSTRVLNNAIGGVFADASVKMMDAFAGRAKAIASGEALAPVKRVAAPQASGSSPFLALVREQRHD